MRAALGAPGTATGCSPRHAGGAQKAAYHELGSTPSEVAWAQSRPRPGGRREAAQPAQTRVDGPPTVNAIAETSATCDAGGRAGVDRLAPAVGNRPLPATGDRDEPVSVRLDERDTRVELVEPQPPGERSARQRPGLRQGAEHILKPNEPA